jgi:chitosanase
VNLLARKTLADSNGLWIALKVSPKLDSCPLLVFVGQTRKYDLMPLPPSSSVRACSESSPSNCLGAPDEKDLAMRLVSAAENSSLCWKDQHQYIEYNVEKNKEENRGYTGGIIGFTSKTGDMFEVVKLFVDAKPVSRLTRYLPALRIVLGTSSKRGLGLQYEDAWRSCDRDPEYQDEFRDAQREVCDSQYFNPAVKKAKSDGLRTLGQFIYYDAWVMHGDEGALSIRKAARAKKTTPAKGGDETEYLHAFLDARKKAMLLEAGHQDTSRVDTMQRIFLERGNLELNLPLTFRVNGEDFRIPS